MKTFTIVSTRDQKKYVIETEATTVGELLVAMDANHIDYSDMVLFEALTKSEFRTTDVTGVLPHAVPYKGEVTDNLVFMLTVANKNIASGAMSRAEMYEVIMEKELRQAIKEHFGTDYTHVSNADLEEFITALDEEGCDCPFCTLVNILFDKGVLTEEDVLLIVDANKASEDSKELASPYSTEELEELLASRQ